MGDNNTTQDLGLVGAWLTVVADLITALAATQAAVQPEPTSAANDEVQQKLADMQKQMDAQKKQLQKQLQKQQIQMQLWQLQHQVQQVEQQLQRKRK